MPAVAAISASTILTTTRSLVTSSATVGIDTTFSPDGLVAPGVQRWVNRAGGIECGMPQLQIGVRKPVRESRMTRVMMKLLLPTLATTAPTTSTGIQPAPSVAYTNGFIGEWMFPERGTEAERLVLDSLLLSLFLGTITASDANPSDSTGSPLRTILTTLEPMFGG